MSVRARSSAMVKTLGLIGFVVYTFSTNNYAPLFPLLVGGPFLVTLFLLLLLSCNSSLRQSSFCQIIEIVICIILTISYVFCSIYIIRECVHVVKDGEDITSRTFIVLPIEAIFSVLATVAYGYDVINRFCGQRRRFPIYV